MMTSPTRRGTTAHRPGYGAPMGHVYQVAIGIFLGVVAAIGVLGGITQAPWVASIADPFLGGIALGVTAFSILRDFPGS
jgi:hypothetical protein